MNVENVLIGLTAFLLGMIFARHRLDKQIVKIFSLENDHVISVQIAGYEYTLQPVKPPREINHKF